MLFSFSAFLPIFHHHGAISSESPGISSMSSFALWFLILFQASLMNYHTSGFSNPSADGLFGDI